MNIIAEAAVPRVDTHPTDWTRIRTFLSWCVTLAIFGVALGVLGKRFRTLDTNGSAQAVKSGLPLLAASMPSGASHHLILSRSATPAAVRAALCAAAGAGSHRVSFIDVMQRQQQMCDGSLAPISSSSASDASRALTQAHRDVVVLDSTGHYLFGLRNWDADLASAQLVLSRHR